MEKAELEELKDKVSCAAVRMRECFPILGETFGEIRPTGTMIVCQLNKPEMKIEIEVTALRRSA